MVAPLQGGGQVVYVGGGQAQRLYLGQLPVLGVCGDQVPAGWPLSGFPKTKS
jgi:hypothetical protein